MRNATHFTSLFVAFVFALICAAPVQAQATRTWVSGVGDDVNPCSRTAPCKTFAGAISKTAVNGEINCLDPGGFGMVTITKSIAIICNMTGTASGGVLGSGTNGIVVNGSGINVFLKGLDIEGAGTGVNGILFLNGSALHVEDTTIRGFNAGAAAGINFSPSSSAKLNIVNTTISENGVSGSGGGVVIQPANGGSAGVALVSTMLLHNTNNGLFVNTVTGGADVFVRDTIITGNTANGISLNSQSGTSAGRVFIDHATIGSNSAAGILVSGSLANGTVTGSTITRNNPGISLTSGGTLNSFGDNALIGNLTSDGAFTPPVIAKQ